MKLHEFKVLSFDCHGILIDWETGILTAIKPLTTKVGSALRPDQILETFARHEAAQEAKTPTLIYALVLAAVHARMGREWDVETTVEEDRHFGVSPRGKAKSFSVFKVRFAFLRVKSIFARLSVLFDDSRSAFAGAAASPANLFFISFFLMFAARVSPYAACFINGGDVF